MAAAAGGIQLRTIGAAVLAALFGYFGGPIALDVLDPWAFRDPSGDAPYTAAATAGLLMFVLGWPILISLIGIAISAHALLLQFGRGEWLAYATAGAPIGVISGVLAIGMLFGHAIPAALTGAPIGALAGALFWAVRRPDEDIRWARRRAIDAGAVED